jgi:hypothetical protein
MSTALSSALGFAERTYELLEHTQYRRADTDEDREAIYRLRYRAYLREGTIQPSFSQRLSDGYDDLDNAWIIGVHVDARLAASFRFHVATPEFPTMPAMQVFADELEPILGSGKTIVDPTRFVIDPAAPGDLHYVTVRVGHMAAEFVDADIVLATVRAEHQAFYRRVFGHKLVCEPRLYPGLTKPISLMMLDYPAERDNILRRYPFFASSAAERAALFGGPDELARRIAADRAPAVAGSRIG